MLINRLAQSIATFILTAAIARMLGADALGQYLLAFSYYFIFVNIASQGLKTLFTRELSHEPLKIPIYLINGTLLQLAFSIFAYAILVVLVFALPYSKNTSLVCYAIGLTIIPFSLSNITEAIFQAQERMHLITISNVPIYILRILVMIEGMRLGYGIMYVSGILVISESLIFLIQWLVLLRTIKPSYKIKRDFFWRTFKTARTFLAIESVAAVNGRIDILIISLLGNEALVGLVGGISQLIQPFSIVASSVSLAALPSLTKAAKSGRDNQLLVTEKIIESLLMISLPFMAGLFFMGSDLLEFLYKDPYFSQATLPLNISAATLIFSPFCYGLRQLLVANNLEKFNLRETVITTSLGSLIGLFLISQYKLIGASVMNLLMVQIAFILFLYPVQNYLFKLGFVRILRRPLIVIVLMIPIFLVLKYSNYNFPIKIIAAIISYTLIAGLLSIREIKAVASSTSFLKRKLF